MPKYNPLRPAIVLFVAVLGAYAVLSLPSWISQHQETRRQEAAYQEAIRLLGQQCWQEACDKLRTIPGYKASDVLYKYALARVELSKADQPNWQAWRNANYLLATIPMDYTGPLATDIMALARLAADKVKEVTPPVDQAATEAVRRYLHENFGGAGDPKYKVSWYDSIKSVAVYVDGTALVVLDGHRDLARTIAGAVLAGRVPLKSVTVRNPNGDELCWLSR